MKPLFYGGFRAIKTLENMKLILIESKELNNNSTQWTYNDEIGRTIIFNDCEEPFTYILTRATGGLSKHFNDILDAFTANAINQHSYKGGYKEAISKLEL
jgi:hypothetical protein